MNEDELKRTIDKLHADYASRLPRTVARMEDLWRRLVAAEIPLTQLEDLVRMAHSITGSGATFGLPSASRVARELELVLEQLKESARQPGPAEQKAVLALLAALRQAAVRP